MARPRNPLGNGTVGGLVAGMIVLGVASGSTFRLVSDQASSAVLAAAEAAAAEARAAFDSIADLTSSRLAIELKAMTEDGVVDYGLDAAIPAENAHTLVNVYVQGVLQPKDGFAYAIIEGGTKLRLSANPGDGTDLYVEGAAAYANPLPLIFPRSWKLFARWPHGWTLRGG